jgi:hypothetical protein
MQHSIKTKKAGFDYVKELNEDIIFKGKNGVVNDKMKPLVVAGLCLPVECLAAA